MTCTPSDNADGDIGNEGSRWVRTVTRSRHRLPPPLSRSSTHRRRDDGSRRSMTEATSPPLAHGEHRLPLQARLRLSGSSSAKRWPATARRSPGPSSHHRKAFPSRPRSSTYPAPFIRRSAMPTTPPAGLLRRPARPVAERRRDVPPPSRAARPSRSGEGRLRLRGQGYRSTQEAAKLNAAGAPRSARFACALFRLKDVPAANFRAEELPRRLASVFRPSNGEPRVDARPCIRRIGAACSSEQAGRPRIRRRAELYESENRPTALRPHQALETVQEPPRLWSGLAGRLPDYIRGPCPGPPSCAGPRRHGPSRASGNVFSQNMRRGGPARPWSGCWRPSLERNFRLRPDVSQAYRTTPEPM